MPAEEWSDAEICFIRRKEELRKKIRKCVSEGNKPMAAQYRAELADLASSCYKIFGLWRDGHLLEREIPIPRLWED